MVTYYVTNPAEDGQVVASVDEASAPWLQDVQVDEANGTVGYTVAANLGTDSRSATLSIVYTWDEGEESLNKTVTIEPSVYYDQSFKNHSDYSKIGFKIGIGVYL